MYNTAVLDDRDMEILPPRRLGTGYLQANDFGDFHACLQ